MNFEDVHSVMLNSYQRMAAECVVDFLKKFNASTRPQQLSVSNENRIPFQIRVNGSPPSVQVRQMPAGGVKAGILRISQKLNQNCGGKSEITDLADGAGGLVIAHEEDLTRECIIVTLGSPSVNAILENGLVQPERTAGAIAELKNGHPDFFLIAQRYIMGIESRDGITVPYKIVDANDEATMQYLIGLPEMLT